MSRSAEPKSISHVSRSVVVKRTGLKINGFQANELVKFLNDAKYLKDNRVKISKQVSEKIKDRIDAQLREKKIVFQVSRSLGPCAIKTNTNFFRLLDPKHQSQVLIQTQILLGSQVRRPKMPHFSRPVNSKAQAQFQVQV